MKKGKIFTLGLCLCILPITIPSLPSLENIVTESHFISNGEVDDIGWFTSLALDKNGYPHISYYDYTNGDLKYTYFTQNGWFIQTIDSDGNVGKYTSLALDENDAPHIAYYDVSRGDLKYASLNNNLWDVETVDSLGNVGLYCSLDLDSHNYPHISYCNYDLRILKYAFFDGSTWKKTIVDNTVFIAADTYFGDYTALVLDVNDKPHISYCDIENFDLKYAFLQGNTWQMETVDSAGDVGVYSSIALDEVGNPHISYADFTYPGFDLKYAKKNDEGWQVETVDKEGDVRKWTSLALGSDQMPHISYYDYTKGSLQYVFFTEDHWHKESVEVNGSTGCFNSLYLSSENLPSVSYYDWGNKALKFASKTDNQWHIEIIEIATHTDFIDQEQMYCSGYSYGIFDEAPMAQSFIPQYPVLTRVELMLVKRYSPGDFTISIRENLSGEDCASVHVASSDIPEDMAWKSFDIQDIYVQTGHTYYIVCSSEDTEENNMYFWYFGHDDPYPLGNGWLYDYDAWERIKISGFPNADMGFRTFGLNTSIPQKPLLDGPGSGKIGVEYTYNISSDDTDDEQLWYEIEWSTTEKETIGPFPCGLTIAVQHSWSKTGDYTIRVKAVDGHGAESDWTTLPVTMPYSYKPIHHFFDRLFHWFPHVFPFIQNFMGY